MAEDLTEYYTELGVKVRYLHSDIDTLERMAILRDLRLGEFDVLVGINLLREGLDLPEVSLVAILDADKEGFAAERSLVQTIGRAARNAEGLVIMYADRRTESMDKAITETERRRALQHEYNQAHGITPKTVLKAIRDIGNASADDDAFSKGRGGKKGRKGAGKKVADLEAIPLEKIPATIDKLKKEMMALAEDLEFEAAAGIRDQIKRLKTGTSRCPDFAKPISGTPNFISGFFTKLFPTGPGGKWGVPQKPPRGPHVCIVWVIFKGAERVHPQIKDVGVDIDLAPVHQ